MHDQGYSTNSDPPRSAIDRYAVTAAGHVLMSAIWLEHRVRELLDTARDVAKPAHIHHVRRELVGFPSLRPWAARARRSR